MYLFSRFVCDQCGAETRRAYWYTPYTVHPAPPWIQRFGSRLHFCGEDCFLRYRVARYEHERERHNARRREQRAKARAEREPIDCAHCGEAFTPQRSTAIYCGTRCRVAAHRARATA